MPTSGLGRSLIYDSPVDGQSRHRGTPNPLEFPIGRWILFASCALLASGFFLADTTGWRVAVGVGLLGASMTGFYLAARLIRRDYPDLDEDD